MKVAAFKSNSKSKNPFSQLSPNPKHYDLLKPFLSLMIIIFAFLSLVFLQMEERRLGYVILKMEKKHKALVNDKRMKDVTFAKLTRPQYVEKLAQRHLTLKRAQSHQVIHMSAAIIPALAQKGIEN